MIDPLLIKLIFLGFPILALVVIIICAAVDARRMYRELRQKFANEPEPDLDDGPDDDRVIEMQIPEEPEREPEPVKAMARAAGARF